MRRLLLLVLAAAWLIWWVRRWLRSLQSRQSPGQAPGPVPAPDTDPMVRDRVCNTFLPRSRAISTRVGATEHFFCSESCREEFLRREGP